MQRCTECGTRSTKRTYHAARRKAGGNYRRPSRWYATTICDRCAQSIVDYYIETRAADRGLNSSTSPGSNISYHSCFRAVGIEMPRTPEEAQEMLEESQK